MILAEDLNVFYYVGLLIAYKLSIQGQLGCYRALNRDLVSDQQPSHV